MDIAEVVERMGDYFEASGRTPMRGRVFGYLLVAEPKRRDFDSIREALQASKSAVSLALTGLTDQGLVKARRKPGKRKRYFDVDVEGWLERSKKEIRSAAAFNDILRECQAIRRERAGKKEADEPLEFGTELQTMINFHEGFLRQVEAFITTWESSRAT